MKERTFYPCLFLLLVLAGLAFHSRAQTITTGVFSPTSVCGGGGTISISFTTTGSFSAINTFSAQLSDAAGSFSNPTVIGTATNTARAISAALPTSIAGGLAYKIRVVSSSPARIGTNSTQTLLINTPTAPGTAPVAYCVGQTPSSLSATIVNGATATWYRTANGGNGSTVAPIPTTTSAGSQVYYVSQTVNGCESARTSLNVTVSSAPAAPTVPTPPAYCEGATAVALSATGQNLNWYGSNATGGTASSTPTVPDTKAAGTQTYYVSQTVGGCESPRAAILVTVKNTPDAPTVAPAPSYCQSQTGVAPLSATASTGGTLNWYGTASVNGVASTSASVPATTQAGTRSYYVSQTVGGCESSRAAIPVTIRPAPAPPSVSSPTILCQTRPATALVATPAADATLNWYGTAATGGTASPSAPTPSTATAGSSTYYVSQSIGSCESSRASIVVTVNPVPALPTVTVPAAYCQNAQALPLTAVGQSLKWYGTSPTGGAASTVTPTPSTTSAGDATYYVSQTANGCESDRAAIPVRVKVTPEPPGTASLDFCQGSAVPILTATFSVSATPNWYGTSSTGGIPSPNPPPLAGTFAGTTTYYVAQTLDGCTSSRASLTVRVKALPGPPSANPVSFCTNAQTQQLTATGDNGSTLRWYTDSDQLLDRAPTPTASAVGTQTFKVSQTSAENCEGPKTNVVVTIKPLPNPPSVANISYCQVQKDQPAQNVSPLEAIGQNLRWYNTDGNTYPNAPTPSLDRAGTQTYQVSQTVDNCEGGKASIQVAINTTPPPTVAKSLYTYCVNDKATPLQATPEAGASLRWVDPYERQTNDAPTPSTLNTNVNLDGDPFYVYQIGSNGCYSARATIRVLVNATPSMALLAPTANVNLGEKAPLRLRFTGTPPYSYSVSGGYVGVSRSADTTISVLPRGNTTYQVIGVTNACGVGLPGNPATAIITVRIPTVQTSALTTATLCAGALVEVPFVTTGQFNQGNTFRIELANVADTTKKYDVPALAAGSPVAASLPTTLPGGQYYVRAKASNPEIGITGSNSPTLLTVRSQPTATLTGTQTINEGTPASLTFTLGGDGPWTMEYADSVRTYSAVATTSPYVAEVRPARTTIYRITSVTNSCGTTPGSGTATVTVSAVTSIQDDPLGPLVNAYPVPTSSALTVELDLPLNRNPALISLYDLQGRPVLQHTTRNRHTVLELGNQPNGLYLLQIQIGDRQTTRKVLKQ